jgi:hypothetical protein
MAKRSDDEKRSLWERRLASYRSSGLTVAGFCRREKVSVASFYYWSRQLGSEGSDNTVVSRARAKSGRHSLGCRHSTPQASGRAESSKERASRIHFRMGQNARVSIPADCLDALRCLVQCLTQEPSGQQEAFQTIVLKTR